MAKTSFSPCAVVDCTRKGRPHVCPYDGTRHGHGRIHYQCHAYPHFAPSSALEFADEGWLLVCEVHYLQIVEELASHAAARKRGA